MKSILKKLTNKEFLLVISSQVIQALLGLVVVKLITVNLSLEDYGLYSLGISITALLATVLYGPINQAVLRYVSIYEANNEFDLFYSSLIFFYFLLMFVTYLFSPLFLLLNDSSSWFPIIFFAGFYSVLEGFRNSFVLIESGKRNRIKVFFTLVSEGLLKIGFILLMSFSGKLTIVTAFLTTVISGSFIFGHYFIHYRSYFRLISFSQFKNVTKQFVQFSLPLIIWGSFEWGRNMSNRWILDFLSQKESVAIYSLFSSLALYGATLIQSIIGTFIVPIIYQEETREKNSPRTNRMIIQSILGGTLVLGASIVFIALFSKEILLLLSNALYAEHSWILPVLLFSVSFSVIGQISTYKIYAHKKTNILIFPMVLSSILSVILGILGAEYYQLNGVIWSSFIVNIFHAFALLGTSHYYHLKSKSEI